MTKQFLLVMTTVVELFVGTATAQSKFEVLHSFSAGKPNAPSSDLTLDSHGNLFGSTLGGADGYGAIFELIPKAGGGWVFNTIHTFQETDGSAPNAVILDSVGNLYGTTNQGGPNGCGVVYQLTPSSGGSWNQSILYSFAGVPDACSSYGRLAFDSLGNLYGTSASGGSNGIGSVFKLTPSSGGWSESVLYSFDGPTGASPEAGLTLDGSGNFFGTTFGGGANELGAVFELSPAASGWTEKLIYSFGGRHGNPLAAVTFDAAGNMYSTTSDVQFGFSLGSVFELSPNANGGWRFASLYHFDDYDGATPYGGVAINSRGDLFGTTYSGGPGGAGTVFELRMGSGGVWTQKTLHGFTGRADGNGPHAGVVLDRSGSLYGTTYEGGATGSGALFQIAP